MSIWWPKICDDGMRKCASKSYREFESVMYNCTACVACSHQSMSESCIPLLFVSLKHSQSRCIFFSIPNASIGVYHFFVSSCLIFVYKKTKYHMFFSATWAHILISVLFYLNEWTSYILFFSVVYTSHNAVFQPTCIARHQAYTMHKHCSKKNQSRWV